MKLSTFTLALVLLAGPVAAAADDLDDAFQALKDAEGKKDPALIKKLALQTYPLAKKAIEAPAPQSADEKEIWTSRVAYAKDIQLRTDYALYATAVQSPPETMVDLLSTLEEQSPKSKYLDAAYASYLYALNQTGAAAKIPAIAEKALPNFPENEDLLLVLANNALVKKQPDRALSYATRLTAALNKHGKPEGVSAADWERKRNQELGRGYWIAGVIHGEKNLYAPADKELRAALPLIKGDDSMMGAALFYLGVANYNLGKMTLNKAKVLEGAKFSEQAAAITGPYAEQAWRNAQLIKTEAGRMR